MPVYCHIFDGRSPDQPGARPPARRPGSVRRTTTHDCTRPGGIDGPVHVAARGRDLLTPEDPTGAPTPLATARLDVVVSPDGIVTHLATGPGAGPITEPITDLVGRSALSGFRRAAGNAVARHDTATGLLAQLVDDLPTAHLLSGRVLRTNDIPIGARPGASTSHRLPIGICAGWIDGGTLVTGYGDLGPPLRRGPDAVAVERDDDRWAGHDHDRLPAHATRRRRRIDAWLADGVAHLDAFFRDTHTDADGVETVVHHYAVSATVDPASTEILTCRARPGPLPYPECPTAAASPARLVGQPLDGLRRSARSTLTGTTTCTHLTDALGCLEGAGPLLRALDDA